MDVLFKPHWGPRLPNGDVGITPTNYLIGVNDPRYLSRAALGKLDPATRQAPYQEVVLEIMNSKPDLKRLYQQMEPGLRTLNQVRNFTRDRKNDEVAAMVTDRQQHLRGTTQKMDEEEDLRLRIAAWEADANRDPLQKPKKFRPPRFHSTVP
ncbi:hypothetical protein JCM5353_002532, partial [Sporobolomyces roseus]